MDDNKNSPLARIMMTVFIQSLDYIKYSLMIPLFLFCVFIIVVILIIIQEFILGGTLEPLLSFFRFPADFDVDKKDILVIYGWLSLIFYIIGSLVNILFKFKVRLSLKKKLKIALITNLLISLPVVFVSFLLLSGESIIAAVFISLAAFSFGMIFSVLAFVPAFIIDKAINFLQKSL